MGEWTMHPAGAKVVPIVNSGDKRQATAVLPATLIMTRELLPPRIINVGETEQCHPKGPVPDGWGHLAQ